MGSSADKLPQSKHHNRHHSYPKSRVPLKYRGKRNKVMGRWMIIANVSIKSHNALHAIFGNRTPEEQIIFLKKLCDKNNILNPEVQVAYKEAFDALFGNDVSYGGMVKTLKHWDISKKMRERYADRLAVLLGILNDDVSGGIPLRKFKLN